MVTSTKKSLHLKKLDPSKKMKKNFTMVVIGHRGTGKSSLMRDILFHLHTMGFPRVVIFSGTEEANSYFSKFVPKEYIHSGLDLEKLKSIMDAQKQIVTSCREAETKLGKASTVDTRLVIYLDDVMFKRRASHSEVITEIFLNGRHWNITLVLSTQYLMLLDIACRSNIDFLFTLREPIPKNRVKLHENFFGMFEKRQDFFNVLDQCTQNYECLVLDNTSPSMDVESCVMWYKATLDVPEFVFGSRAFQKFAQQKE